jgi:hypothetical protein
MKTLFARLAHTLPSSFEAATTVACAWSVGGRSRAKLSAAFLLVALELFGCTDNGANTYGPTYAPAPIDRPDTGAEAVPGASSDAGEAADGDGKPDAAPDATTCAGGGSLALLAGDDASLSAGVRVEAGAWQTTPVAGSAAKSLPALASWTDGFVGVTRGARDALQFVKIGGTTDALAATATTIGVANVKGAPALAVSGSKAFVAYSAGAGANQDFYFGAFDGSAWDAASTTVGTSPNQSFGTVAATLASVGTGLVFAENGQDHGLYVRTWEGAWGAASPVEGAGTVGADLAATPVLVPLDGTFDLVLVYAEQDSRISFATRSASSGVPTWTDRDSVGTAIMTQEKFSVTRIGPSSLVLSFRGTDGNGYWVRGAVSSSGIAWTEARSLSSNGTVAVDSAPVTSRGTCGADAAFAWASAGQIRLAELHGDTLSSPVTVDGLSGHRVAVATR